MDKKSILPVLKIVKLQNCTSETQIVTCWHFIKKNKPKKTKKTQPTNQSCNNQKKPKNTNPQTGMFPLLETNVNVTVDL